jgi:hypothetical protein
MIFLMLFWENRVTSGSRCASAFAAGATSSYICNINSRVQLLSLTTLNCVSKSTPCKLPKNRWRAECGREPLAGQVGHAGAHPVDC